MRNIGLEYNCSICCIIQTAGKYAKCNNLIIITLFICITFATSVLLTGCVNTEGTIIIKGKVIDEYTKVQIPGRDIIVQGLVESNNKLVPINAGQFSTDSLGNFLYSLRKVKNAYSYNFSLAGDSDYSFITKNMGLMELEQNAEYLIFSLSKLVGFTIKIYRKSKSPLYDTLYLSWESDGIDCRILYPYKIDNYGKTDNYFGLPSDLKLRWIGGNVNSTIKTRVFADKRTKIYWDLARNRKRKEIIDTITCKRDLVNVVNFIY
jgi:hypothetical protein